MTWKNGNHIFSQQKTIPLRILDRCVNTLAGHAKRRSLQNISQNKLEFYFSTKNGLTKKIFNQLFSI